MIYNWCVPVPVPVVVALNLINLQRTDPHSQLISYHVLLCYGRRRSDFFRSHKRWQPLLPLLMDHILVEIDHDVEDTYFGMAGGSTGNPVTVPVPIEAKLRSLGVRLLYEVCRVQKLSVQDLSTSSIDSAKDPPYNACRNIRRSFY
jgi:hypothetical protein